MAYWLKKQQFWLLQQAVYNAYNLSAGFSEQK